MDEITKLIIKLNPWFRTNEVPEKLSKSFIRREFDDLKITLSKKDFATLLLGSRRVGKSVLMYQLIDSLIKDGINPKNILFIQGDNTILGEVDQGGRALGIVMETYKNMLFLQDFSELRETVYIFIDEAQALKEWDTEVKTFIDLHYDMKFFITGSSSSKLRQGAQSPLIGRVQIKVLPPFSFSDFVRYEIDSSEHKEEFEAQIKVSREAFSKALISNDILALKSEADKIDALSNKFHIKAKLENYLLYGGFPYVIEHKAEEDTTIYLRDILSMAFLRDILSSEHISDPRGYERLMVNLCLLLGQMVKIKPLSEKIPQDERTTRKYINYAIDSHFVSESSLFQFHSKVPAPSDGKKYYIVDSGIINTLSFKNEYDLKNDKAYRGLVLENVIHNHILNYKQRVTAQLVESIPYWLEDIKTGKEIDFILDFNNITVPIEAKAREEIDEKCRQNINIFMSKRRSVKVSIIISNETLEIIDDKILIIPAEKFLLLL